MYPSFRRSATSRYQRLIIRISLLTYFARQLLLRNKQILRTRIRSDFAGDVTTETVEEGSISPSDPVELEQFLRERYLTYECRGRRRYSLGYFAQ